MKTPILCTLTVRVLIVCSTTFLLSNKVAAQGADDCSAAPILSLGTSCTASANDMKGMNPTPGVPGVCADPNSADLWFQFVATNPWPTITISNIGGSLKAAIPVMQLFTGSCGSLSSLACVTGTTTAATLTLPVGGTMGGAGLTVGQTYFIRVATTTATNQISNTASGWTFTLCATDPSSPTVDYGKSYVNISKGASGGTVEPGDTLEIRATFVVKSNATFQTVYTDNIPTGTTYVPGTLRILTNEGKIYQQFSDASGDDAGTLNGSAVTIDMGAAATSSTGGYVSNTSKPNFYGSTCIMVASFRVVVNSSATYGSQVNVGLGSINYNTGNAAAAINFPQYAIMVFNNYGLCSNSVGTNALINEYGGTFGSGNIKDRAPSNKVPSNYTYVPFSSSGSMPQDYFYGVSNNTSGGATLATGYATSDAAWPIPDGTASPGNHRIFGIWDIIGDHTGAGNPTLGNPPTDDLLGQTGGYMVVVNAAYRTDTAYLDTVYNLCPNTYYQYTAWFRNICSRCGCDVNGIGAGGTGYIPTATGDSSGVYPNLSFNINGYDYYSTGNLKHTGQWVQKGFTYLTGPTQTTMVISIRNNAPGGGGNDWAIDDVGVSSCVPSMTLTPNKPDTLCQGADDTVRFKVTAFFPNYTEWKLEKSTNNGVTWTSAGVDTTGKASSGSGTPVFNASTNLYEYLVTRYFRLNLVDTLIKYRITVASTTGNLGDPNCSYITMSPKLVRGVNCMMVLPTRIISFKGQMNDAHGVLQWISASEVEGATFTVESSNDGLAFKAIGVIHGQASPGMGSTYQFTDPTGLAGARYYRIRISSGTYSQYSNQVMLTDGTIAFDVRNLGNPFTNHINLEIASPADMQARLDLVDMYGRIVKVQQQFINSGMNMIAIDGLGSLSNGIYILQIIAGDKIITRRLAKISNH